MILNRTFYLTSAVLLLAACKPATEAPETAAAEPASAEPSAGLPIHYSNIEFAQLASAEALQGLCDNEAERLRGHLAQLEAFSGKATVDEYYASLDSLIVSKDSLQASSSGLAAVHPDAALREAAEACEQHMDEIDTEYKLSRPIYEAVSQLDVSIEDDATQFSVKRTLRDFRLAGVDQDEATRKRIRELNAEITTTGQDFDRNIREDVRTLELDSVEQLAGLPEDYIAAHPPGEDGKIRITTQYPDLFPFINYSENDELRKQLYTLYGSRGYPQNQEVLERLMALRFELAQLVGFDNWAQRATADKMVGNPERVQEFLEQLKGYTAETNDREYQVLLERLRQDQPDAERLESWQARYVSEKVRREQYSVDSKVIREYFNFEDTRNGMLTMVQDLFQVEIRPWVTETWHADVEAYELYDGERLLGRFYLDLHPREDKYQHAAVFPLVVGIEGKQLPVAQLVCNFPSGNELMQHGQVNTFLHEFGHLIHYLFAGHQQWNNITGITTEWDFVEAPSQMLQEWVWDYDTVSRFARNGDGEVIPEDLLDRMIAARDFGLGMGTRRQLALAKFSLELYNTDPANVDLDEMYPRISRDFTHFEVIPGTHLFANFGHLNGYSAYYYTYQWSNAIATDMFTRFQEQGLRNVEVAGSYRDQVLSPGGSKPAAELVTDFLGREISFKPYADRLSGRKSTSGP